MAITDNLVFFTKANETSGSRADEIGSNTLTDNGSCSSTTGKFGNAVTFVSASSQYLSHSSNSTFQCGDVDFSIIFWVKLTNTSKAMSLVTKDSNAGSSRDYTVDYSNTSGKFRFYINGGGSGSTEIVSSVTVSSGTWYLVLARHNSVSDVLEIIVNGTKDTTITGGAVPQTSSAEFRVGARQYSSFEDYADAAMDEIGLFKRVVGDADYATIYNSGTGLAYPWSGGAAGSPIFPSWCRGRRTLRSM